MLEESQRKKNRSFKLLNNVKLEIHVTIFTQVQNTDNNIYISKT